MHTRRLRKLKIGEAHTHLLEIKGNYQVLLFSVFYFSHVSDLGLS